MSIQEAEEKVVQLDESNAKLYRFEKLVTLPRTVYQKIDVRPGVYQINGQHGNPIGTGMVEYVFYDTYRLIGSISYHTSDRMLVETGDLVFKPMYLGRTVAAVVPVDVSALVPTALVDVELACFQLVPSGAAPKEPEEDQ